MAVSITSMTESAENGVEETGDSAGAPPTERPTTFEQDPREDDLVARMVPVRNICALVGYYAGIFSLVPGVGVILSITAVVLGIIGLVISRIEPQRRGGYHAIAGIVLGLLGCYNLVALWYVLSAFAEHN